MSDLLANVLVFGSLMGIPLTTPEGAVAECLQRMNACHNHANERYDAPPQIPVVNPQSPSYRYSFHINVLDFIPLKSLEPPPLNFRNLAPYMVSLIY